MKFIVLEIQKNASETVSILATAYDDKPHADAAFYSLLAVCALSNLRKHGAMLINENGVTLRSEMYERPVSE